MVTLSGFFVNSSALYPRRFSLSWICMSLTMFHFRSIRRKLLSFSRIGGLLYWNGFFVHWYGLCMDISVQIQSYVHKRLISRGRMHDLWSVFNSGLLLSSFGLPRPWNGRCRPKGRPRSEQQDTLLGSLVVRNRLQPSAFIRCSTLRQWMETVFYIRLVCNGGTVSGIVFTGLSQGSTSKRYILLFDSEQKRNPSLFTIHFSFVITLPEQSCLFKLTNKACQRNFKCIVWS
jgi:hypothetical protein